MIKTFINLDQATERAEFMYSQLNKAGITNAQRFSAVDALQPLPETGYNPHRWGPYWSLRRSEVAVFAGHRSIWRQIVDARCTGVIFEDDVLLSESAGELLGVLDNYSNSFDMIKLDGVGDQVRLGALTHFGKQAVRPIKQVIPSAAAYMVSPAGAEKLLDWSKMYCDHVDDFFTRPWPGYRAYQLLPAVAVQGMFADVSSSASIPASILGSERTTKRSQPEDYDRGPIAYRLGKEAIRTARKISRRLYADRLLIKNGGCIEVVQLTDDLPSYR